MNSRTSQLLTLSGAAAGLIWAAYRNDLARARRRIESGRQFVDTPDGRIEFAEAGNGPAVLVIHGAGGGFDQGLELARGFLDDGYRIVAPSRFGYLGTPLPGDASPQAQADAHARLLDALKLDAVPVVGVSAGGPSAMQLCLRHPDRCSALILVVPLAWPAGRIASPPPRPVLMILNAMLRSDFALWAAMRVAHSAVIRILLGTPMPDYRNAPAAERKRIDRIAEITLPISERAAGILNENAVAESLTPYPLETIRVPALVIASANCGYRTYEGSVYTAERILNAKLIAFPNGGHMLAGHEEEVRAEIVAFLRNVLAEKQRTA